jgi:TonB-linked SusC/RagA family outer membrane protein
MKKLLFTLTMLLFVVGFATAQRTIKGKVLAQNGDPDVGASVVLKGTTTGTITDIDGNYILTNVPKSATTLVVSFVGAKSQEVTIGNSDIIDVNLEDDASVLSEVVVTGLGIKRSEKSLSYSAQTVKEEQLNTIRQSSLNNAIAGKVAGIQVRSTSSMALDRDATIRIRGAGSLSDKQPLYIVDGTPVNSSEISMDDVASVTVLKGPNATAIYGQRGDAGVIIISTKRGNGGKGIGVQLNQSTFFDKVYILPKYQNGYAGGAEGDLTKFEWEAGMPDSWKTLDGKYRHDYSDDSSWGPRMVGQEYIPWYAWYPGENFGKTEKLLPQPNNIRDFYETGQTTNTNVNFSKAGENYSVRVSLTNQHAKGLIPNSSLNKYLMAANMNFDLSKHVSVGANVNYIISKVNGQFDDGYANNSSGSFNSWFHRNLDMSKVKELRDLKSPEGILGSWNHNNPGSYLNSPLDFYGGNYWYNFYTYFDQLNFTGNRRRLFGDVNATYKFNDKFKVQGFIRLDQSNIDFEQKTPAIIQNSGTQTGEKAAYATGQFYGDLVNGAFKPNETNYEALATYNDNFGKILTVDANLGINVRKNTGRQFSGNTVDGLVVPDLFSLSNSITAASVNQTRSIKEVRSVYARGSFGFKEMLYLEWSARNDWSSSLPKNANSYFYPSIGGSFVFNELLKIPALSYGKVRASWAQVGSDLSQYRLDLNYALGQNKWNGNGLMGTPNELVDPALKPSLSSSVEGGIDLRFFKNRLGASFTYYKENKVNEILSVPVTSASGFTSKLINAGELQRKGIELQFNIVPIKTKDFTWDIILNFATNESKIIALADGVDAIVQDNTGAFSGSYGAVLVHQVGAEWGQLRGGGFKRDGSGNKIVDANGFYIQEKNTLFGSVLPKFTGGFLNNFTYKGLTAAFNIDFSKGGKYYSLSDHWGEFSGLLERTGGLNDKGIPVREPVADGGGVKVDAVTADGKAFSGYVEGKDYYQQFTNHQIGEGSVFDLGYVKLREVSVGYNFNMAKLGIKQIQGVNVSFVARNPLLIYAKNRDFDPSEISNIYGENGQLPGTRSLGFNVKLTF